MKFQRFLKLLKTLATSPLIFKGGFLVFIAYIFVPTDFGQCATFRNNPKVLHRPSLCAALLGEFTDKNQVGLDIEALLMDLTGKVYRQYEVAHPEVLYLTPDQINERIAIKHDKLKSRLQYNSRLSLENLDQALYVISDLSDQGFESDRIVWVAALEGESAIKEKLQERQHTLTRMQADVQVKVRESLHEWRGVNWLKMTLMAGSLAFPAMVPEFNALSGDSVLYSLYLAFMFYNSSIITNLTEELGLTPIEWSRGESQYEIQFMEHINHMNEALENFSQDDLIVFSDKTILSTSQFIAMKQCSAGTAFTDIESVAKSCIMETLNSGDMVFNKDVQRILKEEYKKAKLNLRWSRPLTRIREVLFAHPQTGTPILVTGLEFQANIVYPPKKPRQIKQLKGRFSPLSSPQ